MITQYLLQILGYHVKFTCYCILTECSRPIRCLNLKATNANYSFFTTGYLHYSKFLKYQFSSCLERSLETIREECHWLRSVSWELCAQCRLCAGNVDSNTGRCIWHDRTGCSHDDCAHYIALKNRPYHCPDAMSHDTFLPEEKYEHWVQVR